MILPHCQNKKSLIWFSILWVKYCGFHQFSDEPKKCSIICSERMMFAMISVWRFARCDTLKLILAAQDRGIGKRHTRKCLSASLLFPAAPWTIPNYTWYMACLGRSAHTYLLVCLSLLNVIPRVRSWNAGAVSFISIALEPVQHILHGKGMNGHLLAGGRNHPLPFPIPQGWGGVRVSLNGKKSAPPPSRKESWHSP